MFNFGIFTTHIPYIAIVVFYVYFLFFGGEKISKGSAINNHHFLSEFKVTKYIDANESENYHYQIIFTTHQTSPEHCFFRKKTTLPVFSNDVTLVFHLQTAFSNRPPPDFG
jgi:hypothetical protein